MPNHRPTGAPEPLRDPWVVAHERAQLAIAAAGQQRPASPWTLEELLAADAAGTLPEYLAATVEAVLFDA
jgi:hypothetical protein